MVSNEYLAQEREDANLCLRKPLPLTTVELQKHGSRLLRLPPKKVLEVNSVVQRHM